MTIIRTAVIALSVGSLSLGLSTFGAGGGTAEASVKKVENRPGAQPKVESDLATAPAASRIASSASDLADEISSEVQGGIAWLAGAGWRCPLNVLAWNPSLDLSDDFQDRGFGALLVTNEQPMVDRCEGDGRELLAYANGQALSAYIWNWSYDEDYAISDEYWGDATVAVRGRLAELDWSGVPKPRIGQTVFAFSLVGGRLQAFPVRVDALLDSFVDDFTGVDLCPSGPGQCVFNFSASLGALGRATAGSPIVNDRGQVLGTVFWDAGPGESVYVRGTPTLCFGVINCYAPDRIWLDIAPPSPPTIVDVEPLYSAARVTWAPPLSDGGSRITGYTVTASPGGSACTTVGLSCTVAGLQMDVPYTFVVQASNAAGLSDASAPSSAVTPVLQPPRPVSWIKAKPKGTVLRISWLPNYVQSAGHSPWEWFEYRIGNSPWVRVNTNYVAITKPQGKRVVISVRAANAAGYSSLKKLVASL